jgi:hypothetical protein
MGFDNGIGNRSAPLDNTESRASIRMRISSVRRDAILVSIRFSAATKASAQSRSIVEIAGSIVRDLRHSPTNRRATSSFDVASSLSRLSGGERHDMFDIQQRQSLSRLSGGELQKSRAGGIFRSLSRLSGGERQRRGV